MSEVKESVTLWISQLKAGDPEAAQRLWESYFHRMVDLARKKLEGAPRAAADEEDVALSAFKSFCLRAQDGQFTQLTDRENLWPLLMAITANKSVDLIRHQNRKKRGGSGSSDAVSERMVSNPLSELISDDPDPFFALQLADELQNLLSELEHSGDVSLKKIALLKLEGSTNPEIAQQLGCTRRTIERKLLLISSLWGSVSE